MAIKSCFLMGIFCIAAVGAAKLVNAIEEQKRNPPPIVTMVDGKSIFDENTTLSFMDQADNYCKSIGMRLETITSDAEPTDSNLACVGNVAIRSSLQDDVVIIIITQPR